MRKILLVLSGTFLISYCAQAQCYNLDTCWTKVRAPFVSLDEHLWDMEISQASGNVYVVGVATNSFTPNYIVMKYNLLGVEQWTRYYDGDADQEDIAHAVAIDDSENVYVTGEIVTVAGGKDYGTIKYNSAGVEQWVRIYNGTAAGPTDFAYSIFVDAAHNVYVTGEGNEAGNGQDYVTRKYSSGGAVLWTAKYHGGTNHDIARKVVVDNSGNVYVTGDSRRSGQGENIVTVKYNSAGVFQWSAMYNAAPNDDDIPTDLAVDNSGNVYVTGYSKGFTATNTNYITLKYNSAGVQQWAAIYNGFSLPTDEAHALYVDNSGNVYVTGESESGSGTDFLTLKYNSAGVQQWFARYNGTGNGNDVARSIKAGNAGKIYVGGGSLGNGTGDDLVVIEYEASTGFQCHVNRTTLANSQDNIYDIELDNVRNFVYASGETTLGGGPHCMISRYCIIGLATATYNINAAIEGIYNPALNKLNMRDTLRAYLRSNTSPYPLIDTAISMLDSNTLSATFVYDDAESGVYYIVLVHRNSIETWSRAGGEVFLCGNIINYDFTNAITKAYGNNMKNVDTSPFKYAIFSGDINQDDVIDLTDIVLSYNAGIVFLTGYVQEDLNGDYFADLSDLVITFNNAQLFVEVIRP